MARARPGEEAQAEVDRAAYHSSRSRDQAPTKAGAPIFAQKRRIEVIKVKLPLVDLRRQHEGIRQEVEEALLGVARSGRFILGDNVERLESEVASFCGTKHAVGLASGSDALFLALNALGIGPGDEVITSPFSFVATADAIVRCGAKPVFVDIEPKTFNIDPELIEKKITPKTKAILPVHLYGLPAGMDAIIAMADKHGIAVVEDAAQAFGATFDGKRVGSIGAAGCFSFYPTKNLGCYGDGGMVVMDDNVLAARLRKLRDHGRSGRYIHDELGYNSRLDELQASVLRVKLKKVDKWNDLRRQRANRYAELFSDLEVELPWEDERSRHVYHRFVVRVKAREGCRAHLASVGIESAVHYPRPITEHHHYKTLGYRRDRLPQSYRAAEEVLSLPIYPELEFAEIDRVCSALADFIGGKREL